ncbi:MAG: hypothetical protein RLZZ262_2561, partial [Bacteroidota bacterium]
MQCLSITIQNPYAFVYPVGAGQALPVSNVHREDYHACALKTCASTQILWAFESQRLNAPHNLG